MALIACLPLVLCLLAAVSIALLTISSKTEFDAVCKRESLRLQADLGRLLDDLTRMNKAARALRAQRAQADASLASAMASGYPPAIAAAQSFQTAVIASQEAFASGQASILGQATLRRQAAEHEIPLHLKSAAADSNHAPGLAVRPDPPESITPDYVPAEPFFDLQAETYRYRIDLLARLPEWLKVRIPLPRLSAACSATLQEKGKKWKPALKAVNR